MATRLASPDSFFSDSNDSYAHLLEVEEEFQPRGRTTITPSSSQRLFPSIASRSRSISLFVVCLLLADFPRFLRFGLLACSPVSTSVWFVVEVSCVCGVLWWNRRESLGSARWIRSGSRSGTSAHDGKSRSLFRYVLIPSPWKDVIRLGVIHIFFPLEFLVHDTFDRFRRYSQMILSMISMFVFGCTIVSARFEVANRTLSCHLFVMGKSRCTLMREKIVWRGISPLPPFSFVSFVYYKKRIK